VKPVEQSPVLQMQGITKRFPGVTALQDVTFSVRAGEVHCLMGENGAGKSTLMKIMNGIYTEYDGQMLLDGHPVRFANPKDAQRHGIGMIHQELNLVPELRVYENILLGRESMGIGGILQRRKMIRIASEELARLGVSIDPRRPIFALRIAERQLVEVAKALSLHARILVMDEPTSALANHEVERLFSVIRALKASGVAIIYISHRMDEIYSIADYITVLRDGRTVASLPAGEMSRTQLIKHMVGRDISEMFQRDIVAQEAPMLEVRDLSLTGRGVRKLDHISFTVNKGEVVGLAGLMGAGRTETLETIFGGYPPKQRSGEIWIAGKQARIQSPKDAIRYGLGLVTEDRKNRSLVLGLPIRSNATLAALRDMLLPFGVVVRRRERTAVQVKITELDIRTPGIEVPVATLSGGNQQKVVLAKFLLTRPKVLLLDEPTRGIDVGAKAQVYQIVGQLAKQGTAFVIASSEMPELLAVCDRILVLCEGRVTAQFKRGEATQEAILEAATRFTEVSEMSV